MRVEFAQIFTQIVSFILVLWVLKRFAWKPFLKILEERENRIREEFALIEKGKEENAAMKLAYENQLKQAGEQAKEVIDEARRAGWKIAKEIEDRAEEEKSRILTQTNEELKNEIKKAKLELKDELVKITLMATEKLMETNIDKEKQKTLVSTFVDQAGAS